MLRRLGFRHTALVVPFSVMFAAFGPSEIALCRVLTDGTPEDVGMSAVQLGRASDIMRRAVDAGRVTGVQVLVARNSKVVLHEALGFRDLAARFPMQKETLVRMASNTKTVVATGILMLIEEGHLNLADPVSKYLPVFADGLSARLTIQDLLMHTTGFSNQFDNYVGEATVQSSEYPDAPSLRVEAIKIAKVGPSEEPGTRFLYNNWGYTILGAILEQLSGQKLGAFLHDRLYGPLGMTDTSNSNYGVDASRVSVNYRKSEGKWQVLPPEISPFERATGGLVSTAWDFAKLCQMFLDEGRYDGKTFLDPGMVREATSVQASGPYTYVTPDRLVARGLNHDWYYERDSRKLNLDKGYGYGWVISKGGVYWHAGFRGTFALVDPGENLIILLLAQSREGGTPGHQFVEAVYESITDSSEVSPQ